MTAHMHRDAVDKVGEPTIGRDEFLQNFLVQWSNLVDLDPNASQLLTNLLVT
jgi:hypothetical protein